MTQGQFPQTGACCSLANLVLFIDALSAASLFFSASFLPPMMVERRGTEGRCSRRRRRRRHCCQILLSSSPSLSLPGSLTHSLTDCMLFQLLREPCVRICGRPAGPREATVAMTSVRSAPSSLHLPPGRFARGVLLPCLQHICIFPSCLSPPRSTCSSRP